ncbi:MAG TPA: sec-independent translocase [Streptosporangiaceae bacterium]
MFDINLGELGLLAVLALVIFGPERLPKVASQAGRALRQLRQMASNATEDLRSGLPEEYRDFNPADLNPRSFVRRHLFEDDPAADTSSVMSDPLRDELEYGERPPYDDEST